MGLAQIRYKKEELLVGSSSETTVVMSRAARKVYHFSKRSGRLLVCRSPVHCQRMAPMTPHWCLHVATGEVHPIACENDRDERDAEILMGFWNGQHGRIFQYLSRRLSERKSQRETRTPLRVRNGTDDDLNLPF